MKATKKTEKDTFFAECAKPPADITTFRDIILFIGWLRRSNTLRDRPSAADIKKLTELTPKVRVHLERFQVEVQMATMATAARHDMFTLFEFCHEVEQQAILLRQTMPQI